MRLALLVVAGALIFTGGLKAQLPAAPVEPPAIDVETVCAQVEKIPVPAEYLEGVSAYAAKSCSPLQLYYDNSQDHFQAARTCGLSQWQIIEAQQEAGTRSNDRDIDEDEQLALAMLFANGQGVRKNVALAKRFACAADNYVNTDEVLQAIDDGNLDVCSTDYGRRINFICLGIKGADLDSRRADAELKAKRSLRPLALAAWKKLEAARSEYLTAHGPEEPNGTTGATQTAMQEDLDTDSAWLDILQAVAEGKVPEDVLNAPAFAEVDEALNKAYRAAIGFDVEYCQSTECSPTGENTRKAERAWLKYREAWVKFGAVRWPKVPADKWRAWLTVERTGALGG